MALICFFQSFKKVTSLGSACLVLYEPNNVYEASAFMVLTRAVRQLFSIDSLMISIDH